MTQATSEEFAQALEAAGLPELAARARADEFHDFMSPHDAPAQVIAAELVKVGTDAAMGVRARLIAGDFDASIAEGDAWAASPDGKEAFAKFIPNLKGIDER